MNLTFPVQHWRDAFKYLDHSTGYSLDFYVESAAILEGLWIRYSNYKSLADALIAARKEGVGLEDSVIDKWPDQLRETAHRKLSALAWFLPIMESEAKKRSYIVGPNGNRRQVYDQRQRVMFPPVRIKC